MKSDSNGQNPSNDAGSASGSERDPAVDVGDGVRWVAEKGEEAAAVAVGLTILGINRLQVYRRDLTRYLRPTSDSPTNDAPTNDAPTNTAGGE